MLTHPTKFDIVTVESKLDCSDFRHIYDGLDYDILINASKGQIHTMLRAHPERPLIINGHGTEAGLLNKDWNGYVIDSNIVDILRRRSCIIGVWCYAGNFADKYDLHGFFTSMFISTPEEAADFGFNASPEDITKENIIFSKRLNHLIKNLCFVDGKPCIDNWPLELQKKADTTKRFVRYNYEALSVY